jgi:SAM-dependent methyltransferase
MQYISPNMDITEIAKTENFLTAFHAKHPGCTPRAMAQGKTSNGRSSYELIVDELKAPRVLGPILDLACGDGFLLSLIRDGIKDGIKDQGLFGIDLSEGELEHAKKNPNLAGVSLQNGNARALPFASAYFEAVTCHMAFMLMPEADQIVQEVQRVLKPSGRFIAIVGAHSPTPVGKIFGERYFEVMKEDGKTWTLGLGDSRTYSDEGLKLLFSLENGFESCETRVDSLMLRLTPKQISEHFMELYNPFILSDAAQVRLAKGLEESSAALADSSGLIDYPMGIRILVAVKK